MVLLDHDAWCQRVAPLEADSEAEMSVQGVCWGAWGWAGIQTRQRESQTGMQWWQCTWSWVVRRTTWDGATRDRATPVLAYCRWLAARVGITLDWAAPVSQG